MKRSKMTVDRLIKLLATLKTATTEWAAKQEELVLAADRATKEERHGKELDEDIAVFSLKARKSWFRTRYWVKKRDEARALRKYSARAVADYRAQYASIKEDYKKLAAAHTAALAAIPEAYRKFI